MFKRIRNMHPVTGIVVGVVVTLVLSGTAMAITDTSFTYSTTRTGYLTISPMDLAPDDSTSANGYYRDLGAGVLAGSGCYSTGVNLPDRSKIINVHTYYSGDPSSVYFLRNNLATGGAEYVVSQDPTSSPSTVGSVTTTVPSDRRTVWNSVYSYGYSICLAWAGQFEGARIAYQYTSAGD